MSIIAIEVDEESKQWAAAGSNATLYLTNVDPIHLNIGSVLCPPSDLVPLTTSFTASQTRRVPSSYPKSERRGRGHTADMRKLDSL